MDHCPNLQYEATWCITNIASGSNDSVQALLEKGAIKIIQRLLNKPDATLNLKEQCIWALGNMAGDNYQVRDIIIGTGIIRIISQLLLHSEPESSF